MSLTQEVSVEMGLASRGGLDRTRAVEEIVSALDRVVESYEKVSKRITLGLDRVFRLEVARRVRGRVVLDVGAGTGIMYYYVKRALDRAWDMGLAPAYIFLEPSERFLREIYRRFRGSRDTDIVQGVAENLPFRDSSIDTVVSCFMLRDTRSVSRSLVNMRRVSRGRVVVLDFHKPRSTLCYILELFYMYTLMPLLVLISSPRHLREYMYIPRSVVIQNNMRELLQVIERVYRRSVDIRCWLGCTVYTVSVDREEARGPL